MLKAGKWYKEVEWKLQSEMSVVPEITYLEGSEDKPEEKSFLKKRKEKKEGDGHVESLSIARNFKWKAIMKITGIVRNTKTSKININLNFI